MILFAIAVATGCSHSNSSGEAATMAEFCQKCASCVTDPAFDEGFCTPFKTSGGGFDTTKCTSSGDRTQLKNPGLPEGQLSTMSCQAFDDAE
jgi:hypothetical protein